jgi:Na+/melibiose symporter-like transporter
MDVIDYHEQRTGKREEGMAFAFFLHKSIGQTLAGVGLNALLAFIHYDGELSKQGIALGEDVLAKLYDISTLIPAIMLGLMAILLFFGYNLSKNKLAEVHIELEAQRAIEE